VHVAELADLLRETAEHHDPYEKTHVKHNWWDWYAAYWMPVSTCELPRKHPTLRAGTRRRSCMFFPDNFAGLAALSERVSHFVLRLAHRRRLWAP
jgi:hypothetical protein